MIDPQDIESCRARNGTAHPHRPNWVDEIFSSDVTVGRGEDEPIGADDYDEYPDDAEDLLNPQYRDILESICLHPRVTSLSDVAEELGVVNEDHLRDLMDIHEISAADLLDNDDELDPMESYVERDERCPDGCIQLEPDGFQDLAYFRRLCFEDSRVLGALLADMGLSTQEATLWLNLHCDQHSPSESDIKQAATACGLFEGSGHVDYLTNKAEGVKAFKRRRNEIEAAKSMEEAQSSGDDDTNQSDSPSPSSHTY